MVQRSQPEIARTCIVISGIVQAHIMLMPEVPIRAILRDMSVCCSQMLWKLARFISPDAEIACLACFVQVLHIQSMHIILRGMSARDCIVALETYDTHLI